VHFQSTRVNECPTFIEQYEVVGTVTSYVDADLDHVARRDVDLSLSAAVSAADLDALRRRSTGQSVGQHGVADPARLPVDDPLPLWTPRRRSCPP